MAVRKYNPVTPGTRFKVANTFEELTSTHNKPTKSLLGPIKKSGGRNQSGKMTMRYLGGGHKRRYRIIDFKRDKAGVAATVKSIEYDPNRSSHIALLEYTDGEKRYIIAPAGLVVGKIVMSGSGAPFEVGNAMPMAEIPLGSIIHNIEMRPGQGASFARSAFCARRSCGAASRVTSSRTNTALCCGCYCVACPRSAFCKAVSASRA